MKSKNVVFVSLIALGFLIGLTSFVLAHSGEDNYARYGGCGGMGGMMGGYYGIGGMFFGWLFGALVLVALVLLIVWLIKQIENSRRKRK